MYLLARAQSLSGRLDDSLVMLGRIADLGVRTDAATNDDFVRVRALKTWPALEARLAGVPSSDRAAPSPERAAPGTANSALSTSPSALSTLPSTPDTLEFAPSGIDPIGLAHDAVSRRFLLGDRASGRLLVIDEVSRHVVPYVSASSAGLYDELTGFTVDSRRGDLWVVSVKGEPETSASILHKLQLVSGRALMSIRPHETAGPVRFVDAAVTPDGTVYVLDAVGARLFRLRPGARTLEPLMRLEATRPSALAAADDRVVYVGDDAGLTRVDVAARTLARVKTVDDLSGLSFLAWRAGVLYGVQRVSGSALVVRVALDAGGTRARPRAILAAVPHPIAGAIAPDAFYYLADPGVIRRLPIR
jgi:hypothetical protein